MVYFHYLWNHLKDHSIGSLPEEILGIIGSFLPDIIIWNTVGKSNFKAQNEILKTNYKNFNQEVAKQRNWPYYKPYPIISEKPNPYLFRLLAGINSNKQPVKPLTGWPQNLKNLKIDSNLHHHTIFSPKELHEIGIKYSYVELVKEMKLLLDLSNNYRILIAFWDWN